MKTQQMPLPQIFDHEQFGQIRVVMTADMPWFVATDVCRALDIINYRDAVARLDDDEKGKIFIPSMGVGLTDTHGGQEMLIVNEFGLYNLILSSRKPEAKKFNRWITHEVLPALRKYGYYALPAQNKYPYVSDASEESFARMIKVFSKYDFLCYEMHNKERELIESRAKWIRLRNERKVLRDKLKECADEVDSLIKEFFMALRTD